MKEGEYIEAKVKGHSLILIPVRVIKREQEYFWTKEWQEGEREADEDIKSGRLSRAYRKNEIAEFVKDLRREAKNCS